MFFRKNLKFIETCFISIVQMIKILKIMKLLYNYCNINLLFMIICRSNP